MACTRGHDNFLDASEIAAALNLTYSDHTTNKDLQSAVLTYIHACAPEFHRRIYESLQVRLITVTSNNANTYSDTDLHQELSLKRAKEPDRPIVSQEQYTQQEHYTTQAICEVRAASAAAYAAIQERSWHWREEPCLPASNRYRAVAQLYRDCSKTVTHVEGALRRLALIFIAFEVVSLVGAGESHTRNAKPKFVQSSGMSSKDLTNALKYGRKYHNFLYHRFGLGFLLMLPMNKNLWEHKLSSMSARHVMRVIMVDPALGNLAQQLTIIATQLIRAAYCNFGSEALTRYCLLPQPTCPDVMYDWPALYEFCATILDLSMSSDDVRDAETIALEHADGRPMTTWHQLMGIAQLLCIIHSLGGSVHHDTLQLATIRQARYDADGQVRMITLAETELGTTPLFDSYHNLEKCLSICVKESRIMAHDTEDGLAYVLTPTTKDVLECHIDDVVYLLGVLFMAHVFPRSAVLYSFHSRAAGVNQYDLDFRHVIRILNKARAEMRESMLYWSAKSVAASRSAREMVIEASISEMAFLTPDKAAAALKIAEDSLRDDTSTHLKLAFAYKRSCLLRRQGDYDASDRALSAAPTHVLDLDRRTRCWMTYIDFSRAENSILRGELTQAERILENWSLPLHPTAQELDLSRTKHTMLARVCRYKGHFDLSRQSFEGCLRATKSHHGHMIRHLADIACELGKLPEAEALTQSRLRVLSVDQPNKEFRRLLVVHAETQLLQGHIRAASDGYEDFLSRYSMLKYPDIFDQIDRIRYFFGITRIAFRRARWKEALTHSEAALDFMASLPNHNGARFHEKVMLYFKAQALRKLLEEVQDTIVLLKEQKNFYIAGLGTYILEEIEASP